MSVVVACLFFVLAGVWATVGVTALLGKLPANRFVGVRSPETLATPERFALANKVAGPGFLAAALMLVFGGFFALRGGWWWFAAVTGLVVAFLLMAMMAGIGIRAATTLPLPEPAGGCGCCGDSGGDSAGGCAAPADPAADCGTDSCGSCSLSGMCESDSQSAG